jgi:hypothetical protein
MKKISKVIILSFLGILLLVFLFGILTISFYKSDTDEINKTSSQLGEELILPIINLNQSSYSNSTFATNQNPIIAYLSTGIYNANCSYSADNVTYYKCSVTGGTNHSCRFANLIEGNYVFYTKCKENNGKGIYSNQAHVNIDRTPPSPRIKLLSENLGGLVPVLNDQDSFFVNVSTESENSNCSYSFDGISYIECEITGGRNHTCRGDGYEIEKIYDLYVKCLDKIGNVGFFNKEIKSNLNLISIKSLIKEYYGLFLEITINFPYSEEYLNVEGIKFIFEDSQKNSYVYAHSLELNQNSQLKTFLFDASLAKPSLNNFNDIKNLSVYYILGNNKDIQLALDSYWVNDIQEGFVLRMDQKTLAEVNEAKIPDYFNSIPNNYEMYGYNIKRVSGEGVATTRKHLIRETGITEIGESVFNWGDTYTSNRYVTDSPWNINGELIYVTTTAPTNTFILNGTGHEVLYRFATINGGRPRWSQNPNTPYRLYKFKSGLNPKEDRGIIYVNELSSNPNEKPPEPQPSKNPISMSYPTSLDFSDTGGFNGKDSQGISGKGSVIYVDGSEYVALLGRFGEEAVIYIMNLSSGLQIGNSFIITDNCGLDQVPIDYCEKIQSKDSPRFSPDGRFLFISYGELGKGTYGIKLFDVDLFATGANVIQPSDLSRLPDCPELDDSCSSSNGGLPSEGFLPYILGHPVFTYGKSKEMYIVGNIPTGWYDDKIADEWVTLDSGGKLGSVAAINIESGREAAFSLTDPHDEGRGTHFSGVAVNNPGWVIVTYNNEKDLEISGTHGHTTFKTRRYNNEIIAIDIEGYDDLEKGVIRLGQTKTTIYPDGTTGSYSYEAEAHGVPSPDGKYIMFRSCWEPPRSQINAYIIDANLPKLK